MDMTASSGTSTYPTPAGVAPTTPTASWELTALRHERLRTGTVLAPMSGPLWALVLRGVVTLETSSGVEPLCTGDAVWIDTTTAYRLIATDGAELAVADLRLVVPPSRLPTPLIVREFDRHHSGVSELVRACPLGEECQRTLFAASYGGLIGASMVAAWSQIDEEGAPGFFRARGCGRCRRGRGPRRTPGRALDGRGDGPAGSPLPVGADRTVPSRDRSDPQPGVARPAHAARPRTALGPVALGGADRLCRGLRLHSRIQQGVLRAPSMAPQVWRTTSAARRAEEGEAEAAGSRRRRRPGEASSGPGACRRSLRPRRPRA